MSLNLLLCTSSALIFDGSANPAHPKHIGTIDPDCAVTEVVKGAVPHQLQHATQTHTILSPEITNLIYRSNLTIFLTATVGGCEHV